MNTFTVVNRGEATHDFKIGGKKTRILNPGQRQTLIVTLKKGRYTVLCTVPGHAQLGMKNRSSRDERRRARARTAPEAAPPEPEGQPAPAERPGRLARPEALRPGGSLGL